MLWIKRQRQRLLHQLRHWENLSEILSNAGWLLGDRMLRLIAGLVVSIFLARYLGPDDFGLLNFALAFVGMFAILATLGMQDIVVREIVNDAESARATIATCFLGRLFAGLFAFLVILKGIEYLRPDDSTARLVVSIVGLTVVFQASHVAKYYFESQVQSKYTVWVETPVFLLASATKIAMAITNQSLIAFAWVILIEAFAVALGLIAVMAKYGPGVKIRAASFQRLRDLLTESWPLLLSGIAISIYMRIDQIMLATISGDSAVGIYSAAVRISETWYFVPMVIAASVFPSILEAKEKSEDAYITQLQKVYDLLVFLAVCVALPVMLLSDWLIVGVFGSEYAKAAPILAIHVWAGVFVCLGVVSSKWLVTERLQRLAFVRTAVGACINILLNLILIPKYGPTGAAVATVISYSVAAFWSDLLVARTRVAFRMKAKSLTLRGVRQVFS